MLELTVSSSQDVELRSLRRDPELSRRALGEGNGSLSLLRIANAPGAAPLSQPIRIRNTGLSCELARRSFGVVSGLRIDLATYFLA